MKNWRTFDNRETTPPKGSVIRIVGANATPEQKARADLVCDGVHDCEMINELFASLGQGYAYDFTGGTYYMDGSLILPNLSTLMDGYFVGPASGPTLTMNFP